jgi:hypothetical protein
VFYLKFITVTAASIVLWAVLVGFGALSGWWNNAIAPAANARSFMDAAVEIIETENRGHIAFILIEKGKIFDEHYAGKNGQDRA